MLVAGGPQPLRDYARDMCGVVLGVGLGDLADKAFRIAHMGEVNDADLDRLFAAMEAFLA